MTRFLFFCLIDTKQEVVGAVAKAGGVQHLISMATSEHVIMQNEALVALAIACAVDVGKDLFLSFFLSVCAGQYLLITLSIYQSRTVCT